MREQYCQNPCYNNVLSLTQELWLYLFAAPLLTFSYWQGAILTKVMFINCYFLSDINKGSLGVLARGIWEKLGPLKSECMDYPIMSLSPVTFCNDSPKIYLWKNLWSQ